MEEAAKERSRLVHNLGNSAEATVQDKSGGVTDLID